MTDYSTLISKLPKAELHLHIEGSLEPELMFELAKRNQVSIPFTSVEEIRAAYQFSNLQEFLDIYYQGMAVLITQEDFYALTRAYLDQCQANQIRHCEIFFDPQAHIERGVEMSVVVGGISAALADAKVKQGISSRLIMCFLRHLDEASAFATLDAALPHLDVIHGVGLDSSESGHPPNKFQRVFEAAAALGLKTVAHAGEEGPAEYVREALDLLKVIRIDHGNRAMEDAELVKSLVSSQIPLTVCPLSNLSLRVVESLKSHPLKRMLDAGLLVMLNSDDPAYFGGYLNNNYLSVAEALNLESADLVRLAKNSFRASWLSDEEIQVHLKSIDEVVQN